MATEFLRSAPGGGASTRATLANDIRIVKCVASNKLAGSITQLAVWPGATSATAKWRMVIYADNGSGTAPGALLYQSPETTGLTAAQWNYVNIPAFALTPNAIYWLGIHSDTALTLTALSPVPTGGIAGVRAGVAYAGGAPNPFGALTTDTRAYYFIGLGDLTNAYPLVLAPTNPGGEAGDSSGWTGTLGATAVSKRTGSYALGGADAAALDAYQDLTFPVGYEPDVDSGLVHATVDLFQSGADQGRVSLYFLNAANAIIWSKVLPYESPGNIWLARQMQYVMPTGTRKIRVHLEGTRAGAGACLTYFDDLTANLYYSPVARELLAGSLMKRSAMFRSGVHDVNATRLLKNTMKRGRSYFTIQVIEVDSGGESHFNNGFN